MVPQNDSSKEGIGSSQSPDWLRSFPGCEHYTDEEANYILASLQTLAEILLKCVIDKSQLIDNQYFVPLSGKEFLNKAA